MKYYKALDVWSRKNEKTVVRYRCFQLLPDGGYSVQSADHYHAPFVDTRAGQLDKQFLELLLTEALARQLEPAETITAVHSATGTRVNRSLKSVAAAAFPRKGVTPNIS